MSGPSYLPTGDVISSALSVSDLPHAAQEMYQNFKLEIGQIEQIYTVEDSQNAPEGSAAKFTLYDVAIRTPLGSVERIPRCQMLQPTFGGGLNNFFEVLPTDPGFDGKDTSKDKSLRRGHYVLIGYISGHRDNAVILGAMPHSHQVAQGKRPKKGKGTYAEGEIQGLNFSIDNEGALKVVFNGPRKDDGSLENQNGPTEINVDKEGKIKISTNKSQTILIDRVSGKIRIDNGPTYVDMDQNADKIQVVAKTVEVGTGALQPAVVGDDWKAIMEELITEIMALYVPTGVGPSGTPINSGKFASIKGKLQNALSKNHKIEK